MLSRRDREVEGLRQEIAHLRELNSKLIEMLATGAALAPRHYVLQLPAAQVVQHIPIADGPPEPDYSAGNFAAAAAHMGIHDRDEDEEPQQDPTFTRIVKQIEDAYTGESTLVPGADDDGITYLETYLAKRELEEAGIDPETGEELTEDDDPDGAA